MPLGIPSREKLEHTPENQRVASAKKSREVAAGFGVLTGVLLVAAWTDFPSAQADRPVAGAAGISLLSTLYFYGRAQRFENGEILPLPFEIGAPKLPPGVTPLDVKPSVGHGHVVIVGKEAKVFDMSIFGPSEAPPTEEVSA